MILRLAAALVSLPLLVSAQTFSTEQGDPLLPLSPEEQELQPRIEVAPRPLFDDAPRETVQRTAVASAPGAMLRGLDKVSGEVTDIPLDIGQSARIGRIEVTLGDCRYPVDNPAGDAFAYLTIRADGLDAPAFEGWMIASSPALSALDHPRYDVWVMRCRTS